MARTKQTARKTFGGAPAPLPPVHVAKNVLAAYSDFLGPGGAPVTPDGRHVALRFLMASALGIDGWHQEFERLVRETVTTLGLFKKLPPEIIETIIVKTRDA